jgi:Lsr2
VASRIQTSVVSDIDGQPAQETVSFALDGQSYEIDLTGRQADEFRAELAPYVPHARRLPAARRSEKSAARRDLPDIREFARNRGYAISERGRVPRRIIEEYDMIQRLSKTAGQVPAQ